MLEFKGHSKIFKDIDSIFDNLIKPDDDIVWGDLEQYKHIVASKICRDEITDQVEELKKVVSNYIDKRADLFFDTVSVLDLSEYDEY